jgi:dUTP pyrophosphatase
MEVYTTMNNDFMNFLGASVDKDSMGQFMAFVDMKDEEFDAMWPMFKNSFKNMIRSEKFQNEQREALLSVPDVSVDQIKAEKEFYKEMLDEIMEEPDLSDNKKEFFSLLFSSITDIHEDLIKSNRTSVDVKIVKLNKDATIPEYAHPTDAGADVFAVEETRLEPGETKIVKTGIAVAVPAGYEIQVRPRSGLSLKSGLRIANAPGTIDADYRGEIGIIMTNTNDIPYVIDKNMKIAQLVIAPTPMIKWNVVESVEELGTTERGEGGFGSTSNKAVNQG